MVLAFSAEKSVLCSTMMKCVEYVKKSMKNKCKGEHQPYRILCYYSKTIDATETSLLTLKVDTYHSFI